MAPARRSKSRTSTPSPLTEYRVWPFSSPFLASLALLFVVRSLSAFYNTTFDCDEVYNYWEPTHYLMYGSGFQTWEYSPEFALRSYLYIAIHSTLGTILSSIFGFQSHVAVFYAMKCALGLICAACEAFFVSAVMRKFGSAVAVYTLVYLSFSSGMFVSSTALLPSSFAMYALLIAQAAWFLERPALVIFSSAVAAILGWPFVLLFIFPIALDMLLRYRLLSVFVAGASMIALIPPMIMIDFVYYERMFLAPWNIVKYNVLEDHGGPELYGVEPPSYYFINMALNFNLAFVLAAVSVLFVFIFRKWSTSMVDIPLKRLLLYLSPMYLWFGVMTYLLPHKEERFMFVIYPTVCLAAGMTTVVLQNIAETLVCASSYPTSRKTHQYYFVRGLVISMCTIFVLLSVSRAFALHLNYGGATASYIALEKSLIQADGVLPESVGDAVDTIDVCVGKEWYRFPSSFFLAPATSSQRSRLRFLKSGFGGQLPQPYLERSNGAAIVQPHFNDRNAEEVTRYTPISECDYIIDLFEEEGDTVASQFMQTYTELFDGKGEEGRKGWEVIFEAPFLNVGKSTSSLFRALYIPFYSQTKNVYGTYAVLKKREPRS